MTFPFNRGYPQDNTTLGQSKTTIRNNIDGTFLTVGIDHINNNGLPGTQPAGYHNVTHWVPQGADPGAMAGYGQLYSKTVSGDQQLFWETGNGIVQQLTTNVTPIVGGNGTSFLPGGVIIKWGSVANPVTGTPVAFTPNFPHNVFSITLGPARPDTTSQMLTINNTSVGLGGFTLVTGSGFGDYKRCYWMAIGN